jgi:hypothetical protein
VHPRRLLPVLAKVTAALVVATVVTVGWRAWVPTDGADDARRARPAATSSSRAGAAAAVLADWDARRAQEWARGDATRLEQLYVAGSRAGAADVRLLLRYAERGLRVTGLQTQVVDLDVLDRTERRLHLVVTDRVVGGVAVGRGAGVPLPVGRPSTRHVVLVRTGGTWLVDRVSEQSRGQPRAAASTSRTSRSSKS